MLKRSFEFCQELWPIHVFRSIHRTQILSLKCFNWLVFVMETPCDFSSYSTNLFFTWTSDFNWLQCAVSKLDWESIHGVPLFRVFLRVRTVKATSRGHYQRLHHTKEPSHLWTSHKGVQWITNVHLSFSRWQQVIASRLINKLVYKRERERKRWSHLMYLWLRATLQRHWLVLSSQRW